jgi:hypothetical protein
MKSQISHLADVATVMRGQAYHLAPPYVDLVRVDPLVSPVVPVRPRQVRPGDPWGLVLCWSEPLRVNHVRGRRHLVRTE